MERKKIIAGLDVLKFLMALLIVDIHVKGSIVLPPPVLQHLIHPLEGLAVPTFFVISAFLFFSKLRRQSNRLQSIVHYEKRLLVLYTFWTIVWLPIILMQRTQYRQGSIFHGICLFAKDFFLKDTFDASWFFVALLIGVPIVYGLGKVFKEWGVWIIPFGVAQIIYHPSNMPVCIQNGLTWFSENINPNSGLSFLYGLIWISIGYILSNSKVVDTIKRMPNIVAWLSVLTLFILQGLIPYVGQILIVTMLFVSAYTWNLPTNDILYKRLRIYSIIFYCVHDSFKKIPKYLFSNIHNGPLLYVITLIVCWLSSEFIIRMRNVRGFHWLKYAY